MPARIGFDERALSKKCRKCANVVNSLCLEEFSATVNFSVEIFDLSAGVTRPRINDGAGKDLGTFVKCIAVEIGSAVECPHRPKQLGSKEIKNRLGVGMISIFRGITPHKDEIRYTESRGAQDTRLDGEAILVTGGHLYDRLNAVIQHQMADRNRIHGHSCRVGLGQVDCADMRLQQGCLVQPSGARSSPLGGVSSLVTTKSEDCRAFESELMLSLGAESGSVLGQCPTCGNGIIEYQPSGSTVSSAPAEFMAVIKKYFVDHQELQQGHPVESASPLGLRFRYT